MKKIILTLSFLLFVNSNVYAAGSDGGSSAKKTDYDNNLSGILLILY